MWMILRGSSEEMLRVADHAIVEARADRKQHVAMLHRHVRLVRAVHAEHAEEMTIGRRIAAQTHQRIGARKPEQAHRRVSCGAASPRITPPPV